MPPPLISVIIPTYNRYDFLLKAVRSVKNQSYKNIELIIIDDGSTDRTPELSREKDLIYFRQGNKGPAAARNSGVRLARGEWIAFLDSDDLWHGEKLQKQWDFIKKNPDCEIVYTDELWVRKGVRVNKKDIHKKYSGWIYPHCLKLCFVGASTILMHKNLWQKFDGMDENLPVAEDYDLWLRLSAKHKIYCLDEQLIIKNGGRADQLSISVRGIDKYRIIALQKMMMAKDLNEKWRKMTCEELLKKCKIYMTGCKKHGRNDEIKFCEDIIKEYAN